MSRPFWCPIEAAEAGDERLVVGARSIAVELDEVLEDPVDVVERVGPVGVAGQLDRAPDLLVAGLRDDLLELPLQALELTREAGAAQERQTPEPAQPLPELDFALTRHGRRAAAAARRSP
jgi:hypothetical protein